jgi:hypothetical protein
MSTVAVNKIEDLSANQNKGVLQVVSATKTTGFSTTSTSLVDIPDLTVDITPRSADSKFLITHTAQLSNGSAGWHSFTTLIRKVSGGSDVEIGIKTDGSSIEASTMFLESVNYHTSGVSVTHLDSPSTTSEITYKVQGFTGGGTFCLNRRGDATSEGGVSNITVMEIQGVI